MYVSRAVRVTQRFVGFAALRSPQPALIGFLILRQALVLLLRNNHYIAALQDDVLLQVFSFLYS